MDIGAPDTEHEMEIAPAQNRCRLRLPQKNRSGAGHGVSSPDGLAQPIVAWRLWHVRSHEDTYRLESFTWHHVSWPARTRFEAECPSHGAAAPFQGHESGI